ncbi:MAG: hypothetical protein LBH19_13125 [Dysgonamonadaceae bacterium]|nr:hypothetical protein [Dysgonamonadaceae bacterium]
MRNGEIKAYTYGTNSGYPGRIHSIEIAGKHKQTFSYDGLSRVIDVQEEIDGKTIHRQTEYDVFGRVQKAIYPSGYFTMNHYDANGYLNIITDRDGRQIWEGLETNARGQLKRERKGSKETVYEYDSRGFPHTTVAQGIVNDFYNFDTKGNLSDREDKRLQSISYSSDLLEYDNLNRLKEWTPFHSKFGGMSLLVGYDTQGNIQTRGSLEHITMHYGGNNKPMLSHPFPAFQAVFRQAICR